MPTGVWIQVFSHSHSEDIYITGKKETFMLLVPLILKFMPATVNFFLANNDYELFYTVVLTRLSATRIMNCNKIN